MSQSNYTLDIISHHSQFKNKSLRKYSVEGIETVGAWGDEPFEIRFKNNTSQKLQVKLSLDGTDILTGQPANTEVSKDMWVVNPYGVLNLKAWPETSNGGAQFVFTSAEKSVALHTHGDMSNRGIIAAAVFVEGHVEPIRINPPVEHHHHHHYDIVRSRRMSDYFYGSGNISGNYSKGVLSDSLNSGYNSGTISGSTLGSSYQSNASNSISLNDSRGETKSSANVEHTKSLESLVSVGAGQHVDQKITYVTGLIKPMLTTTVRVKYVWWDDLVASLKETAPSEAHPSGFPGDRPLMSIGSTPRVGQQTQGVFRRSVEPVFTRV
jgi:hypothetical protein